MKSCWPVSARASGSGLEAGSGLGAKVMLNSREEEEEEREQVMRGSVRKGVRESERLKRSEEGREAIAAAAAAAATETAIFGFLGFLYSVEVLCTTGYVWVFLFMKMIQHANTHWEIIHKKSGI